MAIDIAVSPAADDQHQNSTFYGTVGNDPPFVIGTGTKYQSLHGLVHEGGTLVYDPADYPQYGQWAQLIDCTAYCESKRALTCLNTYDRARFTFGCLQFAAHEPDGDFIQWLRLLLQLDDASDYFPDLTLSGGRICRIQGGATEALEDAQSSAKLMDYLNSDPTKVDPAETLAAARMIYWTMVEPAVRDTHIEVGKTMFRATIAKRAAQLGLDGAADFIVAAVMDILHQGRGTISQIKAALSGSTAEVRLDRLLGIGASLYASRCSDLRNQIALKRRSGALGTQVYDAGAQDFRVPARRSVMRLETLGLREVGAPAPSASVLSPASDAGTLGEAIALFGRRHGAEAFEGIRLDDNNIAGNVLLVTSEGEYHSFDPDDVLDEERLGGRAWRLWVRRGARAWRSVAIQVGAGVQMRATLVGMEDLAPPPMEAARPGDPVEATGLLRENLLKLAVPAKTIAGAAAAYRGSCAGGDHYQNNCAHFLSMRSCARGSMNCPRGDRRPSS